jgi:hypothetical protein
MTVDAMDDDGRLIICHRPLFALELFRARRV